MLSGDAPLITPQTIADCSHFHLDEQAAMTLLTADLADPTGYGRVLRKGPRSAEVRAIVEEKSAIAAQKKIREINSGFYVFAVPPSSRISRNSPPTTLTASITSPTWPRFCVAPANVSSPSKTADSPKFSAATRSPRSRSSTSQLRLRQVPPADGPGVTIFHPANLCHRQRCRVAADTVIEPFVQICGSTASAADCRIRSYSRHSRTPKSPTASSFAWLHSRRSPHRAPAPSLGPYSHLRPGSDIGEGAHVGNFVETKKIKLGKGSKANHLTYLGDAEIGAGVNIGAGTITCNYDGVNKHTTVIGDGVFIGSDTRWSRP